MNRILKIAGRSKVLRWLFKKHAKHSTVIYERKGKICSLYYRCVLKECGDNLLCYGKPVIYKPHMVSIGNNVTINDGVEISPRGNIVIGDYVTFSRGSQVVAGGLDTNNWANEGYKKHEHICKEVFIGEGTWLGLHSMILPGVSITGKGVIVAAGAVVAKDVTDDYVIVAGVPAKIVKRLCEENKIEH